MKAKLARIRKPWRRALIALVLTIMLAADRPPRVHWVGQKSPEPKRLAFYLFILDLMAGMLIVQDPILWVIAWGGALAFFVMVRSMLLVFQPRRDLA